jgi:hypothetical protein
MPTHKMARWKCSAGSYEVALEAATEVERGDEDGKGVVRWFLAKLEEAFMFQGARRGVNVHNYGKKKHIEWFNCDEIDGIGEFRCFVSNRTLADSVYHKESPNINRTPTIILFEATPTIIFLKLLQLSLLIILLEVWSVARKYVFNSPKVRFHIHIKLPTNATGKSKKIKRFFLAIKPVISMSFASRDRVGRRRRNPSPTCPLCRSPARWPKLMGIRATQLASDRAPQIISIATAVLQAFLERAALSVNELAVAAQADMILAEWSTEKATIGPEDGPADGRLTGTVTGWFPPWTGCCEESSATMGFMLD